MAGTDSDGGGLWFDDSDVTVVACTITGNSATGAGGGLGMRADLTDKKLTIQNSIISGNTATTNSDFTAPTTPVTNLRVRNSLIGDNTGTTLQPAATVDSNGNLIGTSTTRIDPKLGPLAFNGGPTRTHALLADSPAINRGGVIAVGINDQRGAPFVRASGNMDMGAFELQTFDPSEFIVTTTADELDYSNSNVSLREAIDKANGSFGADTITFAQAWRER